MQPETAATEETVAITHEETPAPMSAPAPATEQEPAVVQGKVAPPPDADAMAPEPPAYR